MATQRQIIEMQNIVQMQQMQQGQPIQQMTLEDLMRSAGDIISKAREDYNQICPRKVVIGLCLLQLVTCFAYLFSFGFLMTISKETTVIFLNLGLSFAPELSATIGLNSLCAPNRCRILTFYYLSIISGFCCIGFLIGNLIILFSEDSTTNVYIMCGIQMPLALLLLISTAIFVKTYHQPITSIPPGMFVLDFTSQMGGIQQPVQTQESAQTQGVMQPLMPEA